jgi:hypothetical protein
MKYIKKFNEELKSSTYRSAASSLDYYNKSKSATKLYDFADEKEFGFYNMIWTNTNSAIIANNLTFTQPKLSGIYYASTPHKYDEEFKNYNGMASGKDPEMLAEELVENWKSGRDGLNISFEFSFRATRETLEKTVSSTNFKYGNQNPTAKPVHAFNLQIDLSEWYNGIEDYDEEVRWEAEHNNQEYTPTEISELYLWSATYNLMIKAANDTKFGIFSDRKSAIRFKNWLLTNHLDDIKDAIMNVLRIVGGKGENVEKAVEAFTKMRIQGLYDDDFPKGASNDSIRMRWFGKEI